MKALLVLATLTLFSSASFAADSNNVDVNDLLGQKHAGYMTGAENCNGSIDFTGESESKSKVDPSVIKQ